MTAWLTINRWQVNRKIDFPIFKYIFVEVFFVRCRVASAQQMFVPCQPAGDATRIQPLTLFHITQPSKAAFRVFCVNIIFLLLLLWLVFHFSRTKKFIFSWFHFSRVLFFIFYSFSHTFGFGSTYSFHLEKRAWDLLYTKFMQNISRPKLSSTERTCLTKVRNAKCFRLRFGIMLIQTYTRERCCLECLAQAF